MYFLHHKTKDAFFLEICWTYLKFRKENKLKKGGGYHLDLLILALTIVINSILGIPWYVASTILSITHVKSLQV